MFSAAAWPWRSATTQCSTRMACPLCGSGQRAMSPAAKTPGALVSRKASTTTPRSSVRPAFSASSTRGRTPDAHDHEVGVERAAALQRHLPGVDGGHRVLEMEDDTVLFMKARARNRPFARPRMRSIGRFSGATT